MLADSPNSFIDTAVKHYSSLFVLPTYRKVLIFKTLICICGSLFSTYLLFTSIKSILDGLLLGISILCTTLIADYITSFLILREDPIYDWRRNAAFSLFCWALWFPFIFVGAIIGRLVGLHWAMKLFLLGLFVVIIFRLIVLFSTSFRSFKQLLIALILPPLLCGFPFLIYWKTNYPISSTVIFSASSLSVCLFSGFVFLKMLDNVGTKVLGVPSLPIFKAFLLNWIASLNMPFEEILEKLGEKKDVDIFLAKFGSSKPKAVIVVPFIHPGPFRNVGSSLLPSLVKKTLEDRLNCVVCVPHGLLGHEFDLASQAQNQKVLTEILQIANFEVSEEKATPFVKVSNYLATACGQRFGSFALLSFTLAPKTTEDLPRELETFVRQEAEKRGLSCCVVINAHNSINGEISPQEALAALRNVATQCVEKICSLKQIPFKVGAASVYLKEYGVKHGIGPGGITVVVVEVEKRKNAFVVIDGNNMISGLREKILSSLSCLGIDDGEVFTTDTHCVNAVILSDKGYHPVGEIVEHDTLIAYITEAAQKAMLDLERAYAGCYSLTIRDVTVIGEALLSKLCLLIDEVIRKAKKVAPPIFALCGAMLMLILAFV